MKTLIWIVGCLFVVTAGFAFMTINPANVRFVFVDLKESVEKYLGISYDFADADVLGNLVVYSQNDDMFYVSTFENLQSGVIYNFADFKVKREGTVNLAIYDKTIVVIEEIWDKEKPRIQLFELNLSNMNFKMLHEQMLEILGLPFKNVAISPNGRFAVYTVSKVEEMAKGKENKTRFYSHRVIFHILDLKTVVSSKLCLFINVNT